MRKYWLRDNSYTATLRMEKESSQFPASTFFKPIQKLCLSFIDGKENILFSVDCSGMGNGTFDAGFKPNHPKSNSRVVSSALEVTNAKLKMFKRAQVKNPSLPRLLFVSQTLHQSVIVGFKCCSLRGKNCFAYPYHLTNSSREKRKNNRKFHCENFCGKETQSAAVTFKFVYILDNMAEEYIQSGASLQNLTYRLLA